MESSKLAVLGRSFRVYSRKAIWGLKAVGPLPAFKGAWHLVTLKIGRSAKGHLILADGTRLAFRNPSQLVPALVVFGDYIDPEYPFLRRIAQSNWCVFDVGAAIGQFTAFAARLPVARVDAFEPSEPNIGTLRENLDLNSIEDVVHIHRTALTKDSIGEAMFLTDSNPFMSQLASTTAPADSRSEAVEMSTVAAAARDLYIEHIDCLKVNVAGFEPDVLEGAFEYFAQQRISYLIVLISDSLAPVLEAISQFGYGFYFFHPKQAALHPVGNLRPESLNSPPWPARHVIGISQQALHQIVKSGIRVL